MGLLSLFSKPRPVLRRLPSGSLTVDRGGTIVASTVASSYPEDMLHEIAKVVLGLFREARSAQLPLKEFKINFATFSITAREARGGAVIFLSPSVPFASSV
jgi:hypothetical protein